MFEYLENHSEFKSYGPDSEQDVILAKEKLKGLAPDFIAFIEKFGRVDIDDGYLTVYSWVEDLAYYVTTLGLEKPNVDAWVFGEREGDLFAIDKKTGNVIEFDHESSTISTLKQKSFSEFIKSAIEEG